MRIINYPYLYKNSQKGKKMNPAILSPRGLVYSNAACHSRIEWKFHATDFRTIPSVDDALSKQLPL